LPATDKNGDRERVYALTRWNEGQVYSYIDSECSIDMKRSVALYLG